jgi:hypothetical protein
MTNRQHTASHKHGEGIHQSKNNVRYGMNGKKHTSKHSFSSARLADELEKLHLLDGEHDQPPLQLPCLPVAVKAATCQLLQVLLLLLLLLHQHHYCCCWARVRAVAGRLLWDLLLVPQVFLLPCLLQCLLLQAREHLLHSLLYRQPLLVLLLLHDLLLPAA